MSNLLSKDLLIIFFCMSIICVFGRIIVKRVWPDGLIHVDIHPNNEKYILLVYCPLDKFKNSKYVIFKVEKQYHTELTEEDDDTAHN